MGLDKISYCVYNSFYNSRNSMYYFLADTASGVSSHCDFIESNLFYSMEVILLD